MKALRNTAIILAATVLAGCGGIFNGKGAAETAIVHFHALYNEDNLDEIWKEASPRFTAALTKPKYDEFMGAVERKLGKVISSANAGWNVKSFNLNTTIYMAQNTVFEHGQGTESFIFEMSGTNAVLLDYNIQSMDLIVK